MEEEYTKFCFVVPMHSCQDLIAQTLLTMGAQSYEDWRAIVFDDASTDNTLDQVKRTISALGLENKFKIYHNKEKQGEVRNTLKAMQEIEQDEVVVRLDGGDWLTDNDGLAMLDAIYRYYGDDLAVCWSAQRWSFSNKNISGPLQSEDEDVYLEVDNWRVSHLKTFKRWAMNDINDANYRDENGNYIMNACDRAIMLPMLHKARLEGKKRIYFPKVLYHYTIDDVPETYQSDRAKEQRRMAEFIHNRGYVK